MAKHGHVGRIGYTILERGFLRWTWASEGIDPVEYLAVIEKLAVEQMVEEMLSANMPTQPLLLAGE